jgi:hypothetical protein
MKSILAATAALAIGAAIASPASADVLYNNLNPTTGYSDCSFNTDCDATFSIGDDFAAQLFTLSAAATILSGAWTELDGGSPSTGVNYAIYNDVSGLPSGPALFSGSSSTTTTLLNNDFSGYSYTTNLETFNIAAAPLAAGSYFIAIQSVSTSLQNYLQQGLVTSGAAETMNGGATWSQNYGFGTIDGISVALYSTAAAPLPSTWTMLIAGFAGLGFFAYRGLKEDDAAFAAA